MNLVTEEEVVYTLINDVKNTGYKTLVYHEILGKYLRNSVASVELIAWAAEEIFKAVKQDNIPEIIHCYAACRRLEVSIARTEFWRQRGAISFELYRSLIDRKEAMLQMRRTELRRKAIKMTSDAESEKLQRDFLQRARKRQLGG